MFTLRLYKPSDCVVLAQLFYDTVHSVNATDYTREQLDAWATGKVDCDSWNISFLHHYTVVAECGNQIVGFGDISDSGYLDRLYVHKNFQRMGIATKICDELEKECKNKITTFSSITAKDFFIKRGYCVVKSQQVERRGIMLTNFVMEKSNKKDLLNS